MPKNGTRSRYPTYAIQWSLSRPYDTNNRDRGIKKTRYRGIEAQIRPRLNFNPQIPNNTQKSIKPATLIHNRQISQ